MILKRILQILGVIVLLLFLTAVFFYFRYDPTDSPEWGLTFSYKEARGLGFDPRVMYWDILSDLKPKHLRLMTYWDDTEAVRGKFNFDLIDEQLGLAQQKDIDVVLVVGRKQPRWPECFQPSWYSSLSEEEKNQAVLDMIKVTVEHFRSHTAVKAWQVENEPYFGFGQCPTIPSELYNREVSLVRSLDNTRPIIATDSGDRGAWIPVARSGAEIFGATFYRVSYDDMYGGYYKYPIPPAFYRVRAGILQTFVPHIDHVWDIELQMEPWFTQGALNTPLDLQKTLMNPKVFRENAEYAKSSKLERHYLWGVEWWYWMAKQNNDWGVWEEAKRLLSSY